MPLQWQRKYLDPCTARCYQWLNLGSYFGGGMERRMKFLFLLYSYCAICISLSILCSLYRRKSHLRFLYRVPPSAEITLSPICLLVYSWSLRILKLYRIYSIFLVIDVLKTTPLCSTEHIFTAMLMIQL